MALNPNCHLICVLGGKGGVGKSVLAANLAATFLRELRTKVLLIDADQRSCGDQNIITGLRPNKTLNDLVQLTSPISAQNLNTIVTPHASGLSFVGAVHSPDQRLHAQPDVLMKHIYSLSQHFSFIVADLGSDIDELQKSLLFEASIGLVISTPEILVVNQTRKLLDELMSATLPQEMLAIVLNKVSRAGLDPNAIAQSLRRPVLGLIPQDDATTYAALQRSTPFALNAQGSPLGQAYTELVRKLTGGVLQKLKSVARTKPPAAPSANDAKAIAGGNSNIKRGVGKRTGNLNPETLLKMQIHHELIKEMDVKKDLTQTSGDPEKERELRAKTQRVVSQLVDKHGQGLARDQRARVIKEVLDEALGLGALEELLADPGISEIMVNGCDQIFIEKGGKLQLSTVTFTSNLQLRNVIERIVTPLGRRIDEKSPYVDARLMDGSRVNAVIEPVAIDGPSLTIRKFRSDTITAADYTDRFLSLTKPMMDFLRICVEQGLNIVISGGTGSGKTTLLNVMSSFIPSNERIVTVEDAAELQLKQDHVVRLETRPANMEGAGEISIRDLVRNALRMRPDRIVVGECRDGAALDMLSAMNTGHDGSMTTIHANNPREGIARLETLCLMAGLDLPIRAIREQIAGAVDMIVQIGRMSDGTRKVKSITEVVGMQGETITLQEIFRFKEEGFDKNRKIVGQFQAMGLIPTFIEKFEQRGVIIPRDLFSNSQSSAAIEAEARGANRPKPTLRVPVRKPPGSGSGTAGGDTAA